MSKINFNEYIKYFKNLKIGVKKGCELLRELEPWLEKLRTNEITEYKYYNPDTQNTYYFEEKNIPRIQKILELLIVKHSKGFPSIKTGGSVFFKNKNISKILFDLNQDKDFLFRLVVLTNKKIKIVEKDFLEILGNNILEYYFYTKKYDTKVFEIQQFLEKKNLDFDYKYLELSQAITLGLEKTDLKNFIGENITLDVPEIFPRKNPKCYIDKNKFYKFLIELDDYRLNLDAIKLNKYYPGIDLQKIKEFCFRIYRPKDWEKIKYYMCDFLSEDSKFCLDNHKSLYYEDVFKEYKKIPSNLYKSVQFLKTKIFINLVASCFSSFKIKSKDFFFSKSKNWIKKYES